MLYFLLFFSLLFSLFADLAVTENDPATLVEGVSVITGDLYSYEEDYTVRGAEPIRLHRSFISREGFFRSYQHLTATFTWANNKLWVNEHNGTALCYYADSQNQVRPNVGDHFYGEKQKHWKALRYNAYDFAQTAKGVANTSSGKISAQTHLKNQYIIFDPSRDGNGMSFTLYASDGTKRRYTSLEGQKQSQTYPTKGVYLLYRYKLVSETLPNGHIIHYQWNQANQVFGIYTTNEVQSKIFAKIHIPVFSEPNPTLLTYTGSDGRSVTYKAHPTEVKHLFVQCNVISPDLPEQSFGWSMKPFKYFNEQRRDIETKRPYLQLLSLPKHRALHIGYSDVEDPVVVQAKLDAALGEVRAKIKELAPKAKRKPAKYGQQLSGWKYREADLLKNGIENEGLRKGYLVKTLSSPVGKDANPIVTHSFFYDKENKKSYVLDVKNNKTAYFWNDDYRLTRVERYVGVQEFHSEDTFLWENTHLRCKAFQDQNHNPIFSRVLIYDNLGNVETDTFYGNLSGKGVPLKIGSNGFPLENGVEKFTKRSWYRERNLLERQEEGDLTTRYTYRDDAQLIKSKEVCDRGEVKIRYEYEYDRDLILNYEIVKDDVGKIIKKVFPLKSGPFVGMPEILEEKYLDGDAEILLKKTVLHYEGHGLVDKKEIYDAHGKMRYQLLFKYDEKERLISETNPIGREAIYKYDDVGNREYVKDFSGRLETFYKYDFSNRLIEKKEKGDDGVDRTYVYEYDAKHNLISETDPFENKTTYIPDAFGHRTEIHLSPVLDEKGEAVSSITYFKYDSAGNEIEKKDAAGNVTKTKYNAYGKPVLVIHPDGSEEELTYYLNGNLKTHTDPKEVITLYEYDYLGRVLKKTVAGVEETFEYSGQYLKKKTDAEKNETIYEYDRAGRKTSEKCSGEETTYTYDELGRLHTTQKEDLVTVTEYDLLDRVIEERNESIEKKVLRKVKYEYDESGNRKIVTRFINGKEEKEEFKYDSVNRLIEKKDALGFVETYEYDPKINKKTYTDPMSLQTIETYNAQNQIASIEKKKGGKTLRLERKYYDKNGKLALQIDTIYTPDGKEREIQTRWKYNPRGHLEKLTEADGILDAKITHYTYTVRGELETVTKPDGTILTYRYNNWGHLESLTSSDGTVNHQMEYNQLGHLQRSGQLVRTTDPFGRILSETFPNGHCIKNTYDNRGRRDRCEIPAADCWITYEYDPANLKKVHRKKLDETVLYTHVYTSHDLSGNLLEQELIHNVGKVQFSIDPLSRKTAINCPQFTQEVLEFDPVGNIHKMRIETDEINYTYDDLYQLTSESGLFAHSYLYDSLYNRLKKDEENYEINPLNQVTSHLEYNKNGNPIQHGETTYFYDALDRLIRIETPDVIQTFTYDCLHRCLSKTTNQKTQYFLYDGKNEIGSFDENLAPIELRILGNAPHAEIGAAIAIEIRDQIYAPIHDLQGNIAALLPLKETSFFPCLNEQPTFYRYSAFGEEKIIGSSFNPWRFSSKRSDQTTGLVNFGRRYYFPEFGRWLTPDPAGFTDGMNLYAFVLNDPLVNMDLYGLAVLQPLGTDAICYNYTRHKMAGQPFSAFSAAPYSNNFSFGETRCYPQSYGYMGHNPPSYMWNNNQFDEFRALNTYSRSNILPFIPPLDYGFLTPDYTFLGGFIGKAIDPLFRGIGLVGKKAISKAGARFGNSALSPARKLAAVPKEYINPHSVRFTQPTISQNFSKGGDINKLIEELRLGKIKVEDVPIIRVVEYEGKIFTLDNRRLAAFQNAGMKEIPIEKVSLKDPKIFDEFYDKFNPVNDGINTVIIPQSKFRDDALKVLKENGKIK